MPVDDFVSNRSENRPFEEVLEARLARRTVVAGGLAVAAATFLAPAVAGASTANASATAAPAANRKRSRSRSAINFAAVPIAAGTGPLPAISDDYQYQVLLPWGEPILAPFPEHTNGSKTAYDQERQIGIGHDGMWFFADRRRNDRGVLCLNHEFGRNTHVLGKADPESPEDVRLSQAAHGVSVVALRNRRGTWQVRRNNRRNRRIHVNTPVKFSGPVAGHELLGDPKRPSFGTLNNCSSGYTPWGTYVTCEENFNGYFGDSSAIENADGDPEAVKWQITPEQERYGFAPRGFGYGWENFDPRFDLSNTDFSGEDNRFGWCVEINPQRPKSAPIKRTAMGRFKHEGVAFAEGRGGRIVGYMGDDQRFDYIYRYVSKRNWRSMIRRGQSPLDEGALYVARFDDDGSGEWLELTIDNPVLAERFKDQAEVLTYARLAADAVGATPMDRPEWTTVAPDGTVYCTLTNNSRRESADSANPLAPNPDGHIIRWKDSKRHTGTSFEWDIYLLAQDSHGTEDTFSSPDGIWADPDGRIFIQTDGGQKDDLNNQMLVANPQTGELRRLLTGVTGDEITGLTVTPDRRTLFANTQHPGNGDPSLTNFPVMNETPDGTTIPRDAMFVITKKDGGIVGS